MIAINIKDGKIHGETATCQVDKDWHYGDKNLHTPLGDINLVSGCDLIAAQILISDNHEYVIVQTKAEWNRARYGEFYAASNHEYRDASAGVYSPAHQQKLEKVFGEMRKHLKPIK